MQFSVLLFLANAVVLAAGTPTPAAPAPRFKCTSLVTTTDGQTPSVQSGPLTIPNVPIGGTSTGANKSPVCCKTPLGGAGGLADASCLDGYITNDGTCPDGDDLCCVVVAANNADIGPAKGAYTLCEPGTPV